MVLFTRPSAFWRDRLLAAALHLCLTASIATFSALLVFGIWYPYPYREISGGRELFLIIMTVDVVIGPLITFLIFNRNKCWSELRRDMVIVGLLQVVALAYGLWIVGLARPVHLVFEIDRFRVVHAIDVPPDLLNKASPGITALPLMGPSLLGIRAFKDEAEKVDATLAALQGVQLGFRPDFWQSYESSIPEVLRLAKPVSSLVIRFPNEVAAITATLKSTGRKIDNTVFLPLVGRKEFWTVFIDPATASIVAVMPLDSF